MNRVILPLPVISDICISRTLRVSPFSLLVSPSLLVFYLETEEAIYMRILVYVQACRNDDCLVNKKRFMTSRYAP